MLEIIPGSFGQSPTTFLSDWIIAQLSFDIEMILYPALLWIEDETNYVSKEMKLNYIFPSKGIGTHHFQYDCCLCCKGHTQIYCLQVGPAGLGEEIDSLTAYLVVTWISQVLLRSSLVRSHLHRDRQAHPMSVILFFSDSMRLYRGIVLFNSCIQ